ncbi:hypothetical protein [Burkholderia sp. Tr-20355]|uniref:hypothetical protein n=1 Tax=Burkholderia sp. Tr-20355 TaxID=2703895 RepID=UPI00197F1E3F|nr:hypothetical protein [Burkholderia sp. Tr-20355]MBN3738090.1 hypothetical protein [Burkholderia sp. Tr-20355]
MKRLVVTVAAALLPLVTFAVGVQESTGPRLISVWQSNDLTGSSKASERVAGIEEMDSVYQFAGANCGQFIGFVKVEGIQFTPSGGTLETFRFTDKNGNQWSVPTNIGKLSNIDRQRANSLIRVGHRYFVHVQVCGSGGIASLINLYDPTIAYGPVR